MAPTSPKKNQISGLLKYSICPKICGSAGQCGASAQNAPAIAYIKNFPYVKFFQLLFEVIALPLIRGGLDQVTQKADDGFDKDHVRGIADCVHKRLKPIVQLLVHLVLVKPRKKTIDILI